MVTGRHNRRKAWCVATECCNPARRGKGIQGGETQRRVLRCYRHSGGIPIGSKKCRQSISYLRGESDQTVVRKQAFPAEAAKSNSSAPRDVRLDSTAIFAPLLTSEPAVYAWPVMLARLRVALALNHVVGNFAGR